MTFGSPALLALLLFLPLAVVVYALVQRRRPRYTARFTNLSLLANVAPRRPAWRRWLPPTMYLLALGALLTALAKPYATVKLPKQEGTVMLAIDVSGSMEARDVRPTRLSAAVTEAEHFVDQLPGRFQVGVVAFASNAQVLTPPTTDRVQVKNALESLRANGGTAMGDGIERSLDFTRQATTPPTTHDFLRAPAASATPGSSASGSSQQATGAGSGAQSGSGQPGGSTGQPGGSTPGNGQQATGAGSGGQGSGGQQASGAGAGAPGGSGQPGAIAPSSSRTGTGAQRATGQPGGNNRQPGGIGASAPGGGGQAAGGQRATGTGSGNGTGAGGNVVVGSGKPMAIVLLSDGANNSGQATPEGAAADASELHVPIYTIALGTAGGTLDVRVGPGFVRRIAVPPDPATLRRVAEISGGKFFSAPSDRDLHSIYDNLATRIGFETQQQDVTPLFIGAAAVLLLIGGSLATLWFHRFP